ncbi:hypothetical protein SBADM41S_02405 [Streptomyces badius]
MAEGLGRVVGEGVTDGVGVCVAFEPGGDRGREVTDVVLGEGELRCVAAQVAEERGGGAVEFRGEEAGLGEGRTRRLGRGRGRYERYEGRRWGRRGRYGKGCGGFRRGRSGGFGRRRRNGRHRRRVRVRVRHVGQGPRRDRCLCRGRYGRLAARVRQRGGLVAEDGAGDDLLAGQSVAEALQVAVGFEFAEGCGDALLAFFAAGGEGFDADLGPLGQGLDAYGDADGGAAEVGVLGEVVADDGEAVGVGDGDVDDAGGGERSGNLRQGAGEGSILLGIHREAVSSLVVRPPVGIAVPVGGRRMCGMWFWREHMPGNLPESELSWEMSPV